MKKKPAYLKFTNAEETHKGFKFRTGLNTDTNKFNPDPADECGPYGLYFTDVHKGTIWLGSDTVYARKVTLPKGERKVTLEDKYRAHRIILGPRHDLSKVAAWKWLASNGLDATAKASYAIQWASASGHLDVVKYLASKGADVTARDNQAFCWASEGGHLDVVKYLVSIGADVTTWEHAVVKLASENGHLDVVKYLVSKGADVTADDNYAVRWASMNGHLDVVKYLVSWGADVTADDNAAVRWASMSGHLDVVKYLVSKGARLPVGMHAGYGEIIPCHVRISKGNKPDNT